MRQSLAMKKKLTASISEMPYTIVYFILPELLGSFWQTCTSFEKFVIGGKFSEVMIDLRHLTHAMSRWFMLEFHFYGSPSIAL